MENQSGFSCAEIERLKKAGVSEDIFRLPHDQTVGVLAYMELISRLIMGTTAQIDLANEMLNAGAALMPKETWSALKHLVSFRGVEEARIQYEKSKVGDGTGCVYIIEYEGGAIKIGMSATPEGRVRTLSHQSAAAQIRHWISEKTLGYVALERMLHREYSSARMQGEFFSIPFDVAVEKAKLFFGRLNTLH